MEFFFYSFSFASFMYIEAYTFWVIGWVFMVGLWSDIVTTNNMQIGLKKAPYIVLIGGLIFFGIFQTISILDSIFVLETLTLLSNILFLVISLSIVIFPLVFGTILLKKLNISKKISVNKRSKKLILKTKIIMSISIIFGVFILILIAYTIIQFIGLDNGYIDFVFQYIFRVNEIIGGT